MANSFKPKREEIRRALNRLGFVGDYTKLGDIIMELCDDIAAEASDRKTADRETKEQIDALEARIGSAEPSEVLKVKTIGTGLKLSENGTLSIDCATVSETSDAVNEKIGGA